MYHDREPSVLLRNMAARRVLVDHLKRCPVCGALNTYECKECFVCTWHGCFDHDSDSVEASLDEMIMRCPELVDAMMIEASMEESSSRPIKSWFQIAWMTFKSWFSRRPSLDIRA